MASWGTAFRSVSVAGRRQVFLLIALGAAFIIGVVALSAWQLWRSRADVLTDGVRDSRNITAVLGAHTSRIIKSIGLMLTEIAGEPSLGISGSLDRLEAHEMLKRYLGAAPMVRSFFVLDKDGFVFVDSGHAKHIGDRNLRCALTIRDGKIVWDEDGLSMTEWSRVGPYSNYR